MMGGTTTTGKFNFAVLKKALEQRDALAITGLYADDAEMIIVDRDRPPSAPMKLIGKAAIKDFWQDVCAREMTHKVGNEVVGPSRAAFVEECAYPDGCHVMAAMTLDLRDGLIIRHLTVQAWDATS